MSLNFTHDLDLPSYSVLVPYESACYNSTVGRHVITACSFTYSLFVLPPTVFVLHLGVQRWSQRLSASSAAVVTPSDFFTYNMAVSELIEVLGLTIYYCTSYSNLPVMWLLGVMMSSFTWPAQTLFPIIICMERYLAVVHPILYRGLRQVGGVRIRNITTGCVWLTSALWLIFVLVMNSHNTYKRVLAAIILILSLVIILFCSVSVVSTLIRRQPGKVARDRVHINQSKQRAIRTVLIIMGVLWLKFGGNVVTIVVRYSAEAMLRCVGEGCTIMFYLPGSVVLPLLFLYRAGKVPHCKRNTGSA